jgi:hypothetical protein
MALPPPSGRLELESASIQARFQADRLREHAVLSRLVQQLPVMTAGGRQMVWCIERRGIDFWMGGLQLDRVRKSVRPRILEFQEALVDAADRLFWGEVLTLPGVVSFALALEQRIGRLEERVLDTNGD